MPGLTSQQVLRWQLLLEEFGPDISYLPGESNTVTDALSRLKINGHHPSSDILQECFGPTQSEEHLFPLSTAVIAEKQQKDKKLMTKLESKLDKDDSNYDMETVNGVEVITMNGKIVIPKCLTADLMNWYHHFLHHPGVV